MGDNPIVWLSMVTFAAVLAFAGWSWLSTRRNQKYGNKAEGIGSPKDPMS